MKIITILGTRPEIIKLSPLIPLLDREFNHKIIHTGQHYSYTMDKVFFEDLEVRDCDYTLNIGSATHGKQTGEMMIQIEEILLDEKPDLVLVQGDTNTTLAGALTASKLNIKVAHVEAGCRSFDKIMPEEINRVLVDHCSNFLFAPDKIALNNLAKEGILNDGVYLVGNTSIDACLRAVDLARPDKLEDLSLEKQGYALLTIHRQENTSPKKLKEIIKAINTISKRIKVVFPAHLRTKKVIDENEIGIGDNLILREPLGYKDFIGLLANSKFIMTDSGGIQEESAVLNVPCLILRDNTEWKYLVDIGKNALIGTDEQKITDVVNGLLDNEEKIENMSKIKASVKTGASEEIISVLKKCYNH
jgi:UDP-N-acetylglucosamine 2-epimerase (non-hydrolysing)